MQNKYHFEREIKRGGFGVAYLVTDLKENKTKVIKKVCLENIKPEEIEHLNREAELLSRIEHNHVLVFFESFFENENFYLVTEYCEGGDLNDFLKSKKTNGKNLTEKMIIESTFQLLSALNCLHSNGIIHRDLKTRNVFLKKIKNEDKIDLVIGDFGISKGILDTISISCTNHFKGTISYASPERYCGTYDFKCDIWALGCIIYEMCTFELAFPGDNVPQIILKIVQQNAPELPVIYSNQLSLIYKRMLEKNPEKRPTAKQLLKDDYLSKNAKLSEPSNLFKIKNDNTVKKKSESNCLMDDDEDVIYNQKKNGEFLTRF